MSLNYDNEIWFHYKGKGGCNSRLLHDELIQCETCKGWLNSKTYTLADPDEGAYGVLKLKAPDYTRDSVFVVAIL